MNGHQSDSADIFHENSSIINPHSAAYTDRNQLAARQIAKKGAKGSTGHGLIPSSKAGSKPLERM